MNRFIELREYITFGFIILAIILQSLINVTKDNTKKIAKIMEIIRNIFLLIAILMTFADPLLYFIKNRTEESLKDSIKIFILIFIIFFTQSTVFLINEFYKKNKSKKVKFLKNTSEFSFFVIEVGVLLKILRIIVKYQIIEFFK